MAHPTDVHVGRRLREARLAKGMTQTDLGIALEVSFQQVQKYEKGMIGSVPAACGTSASSWMWRSFTSSKA